MHDHAAVVEQLCAGKENAMLGGGSAGGVGGAGGAGAGAGVSEATAAAIVAAAAQLQPLLEQVEDLPKPQNLTP